MTIKVLNDFLPHAEEENLGAIKVGESLNITSNGTLDVSSYMSVIARTTNAIIEIPCNINVVIEDGKFIVRAGTPFSFPDSQPNLLPEDKEITTDINGEYCVCVDSSLNLALRTTYSNSYSLPLAKITVYEGRVYSIDQIYNGFGFIDNTVFVLPGVKGLIPAGRDNEGGLHNTSFTYAVAKTVTVSTDNKYLIGCDGTDLVALDNTTLYNETTNFNELNGTIINYALCGDFTRASGTITDFRARSSFHALDYYDLKTAIPSGDFGALAWKNKVSTSDIVAGGIAQSAVTNLTQDLNSKQNLLTFDNVPTENSNNPVKSGGIYSAIINKQDALIAGEGIDITNNVISEDSIALVNYGISQYTDITALILNKKIIICKYNNIIYQYTGPQTTSEVTYYYFTSLNNGSEIKWLKVDPSSTWTNSSILVQSQITGAASTITSADLNSNRVIISNASGKITASETTSAELGYVHGVTSSIQTQLDDKVTKNLPITGATKAKITYDSKGLVTGGTDLQASDIPDISATYQTKLVSGTNIKTINNSSIVGSGNLVLDTLPSQAGQNGKYLTTNGSSASWVDLDALPSQVGNTGKFLKTNGVSAVWTNLSTVAISGKASDLDNDIGFITQDINVNATQVQYTLSDSNTNVSSVTTWSSQATPLNTRQRAVCYGNGYWITCGVSGSIAYSTNGTTWTSITPFCTGTITGITYGNGYFLAVEYETKKVWKAELPTGTWTNIYTATSSIESIQYINNTFVITGENGLIALSETGEVWNTRTTSTTYNIIKATYGNGLYVAVGASGVVLTSINGIDWTLRESGLATDLRTVVYGNSKFICGGKNIIYSTDGITWTAATTLPEAITGWIREFAYAEKRYYCAVYTSDGSGQIWYSDDCITWTKVLNLTASNSRLWCMTYGNGIFLSTGDVGSIYTLNLENTWTENKPTPTQSQYVWYRNIIIQNNGSKVYSDAYYIGGSASDILPSQSGQSGKYLTTDGANISWSTISIPTITDTYDATSSDGMSGKAVASAISNKADSATTLAGYGITDTYTKTQIDSMVSSVYKAAGSTAFANKPALSPNIEGNVYNITDAFTTTSDFVDGAGINYPAGTNIVCINTAPHGQTAIYKWDVLSDFVDLSNYQTLLSNTNKLNADYILDGTTNKVVTATEKSTWNNKVDKVSSNTKIYATNGSGSQTTLDYSIGYEGATIAQRTSDGQVRVASTPSGNNDATSKSYVDTELAKKVIANPTVTGATKCKITYDSKGLVTAGADLQATDIPDLSSVYQVSLVSGTNIKTINNQSVLGSGNIEIQASNTWTYDSSTETLTIT